MLLRDDCQFEGRDVDVISGLGPLCFPERIFQRATIAALLGAQRNLGTILDDETAAFEWLVSGFDKNGLWLTLATGHGAYSLHC